MFEPNPIQARLLMAVQNLAAENQHLIDRSRAAGDHELTPTAQAHLHLGRRTQESFEAVATAVGVPQSVLAYTAASGQRGHRWQPGQPLLSTEEIARDTLLAGHRAAVGQLQEMAGIGAALAHQEPLSRAGFAAFRRVMGYRWQQVGAVGHALALTTPERQRAWEPTDTAWTTTVARTVGGLHRSDLVARWRAIVDTESYLSIPVRVLRDAGISLDDISRQLPVPPDRMVELTAAALQQTSSFGEAAGGDIGAAIEVTGTELQTEPETGDHTTAPEGGGRDGRDVGPDP
ncbi:hypothetical protein ACFWPX_03280 [Nocardia sp. NPDC058518]|uniref:hypothetical protein n=1 Tax=Nocardia sp. NPDC058518 TaxID=3346534 RepID=UPI00365B56F0